MKLLKSKNITCKKSIIATAIAMSVSAFAHAGVTFTELPVSTWGGHIAVNDQGTVVFSGDYSLYKWNATTGLIELGNVSWGRVARPDISIDGNAIAFSNVGGDTVLYKNGVEEIIPRTTLDLGSAIKNGSLSPNGDYLLGRKMGGPGQTGNPARYNIHTSQIDAYSELDDPSTNTDFLSFQDVSLSGEHKLFQASALSGYGYSPVVYYQEGNNEPVQIDIGYVHLGGITENGQYVLGEDNNCNQVAMGQVSICAALWNTSTHEVTELGYFRPTSVNRDGSLVVGGGWSDQPGAKVWDSLNGTRNLTDVLQQHGVTLTGWSDFKNLAVSPDGNYIAGYALNPAGERKPFVVNIVPECYGF